jgi:hypothetical protein
MLNSLEAKCDLALKSDAAGTRMVRFFPKIVYADGPLVTSYFAYGAVYNGAEVAPLPKADAFLQRLFKRSRPKAQDVKILETEDRKDVAQAIQKACEPINAMLANLQARPMTFQAAALALEYAEDGTRYKEAFFTVIGDFRAGAGTWWNDMTFSMRAPAAEAEQWKAVFEIIRNSLEFNPEWVRAEQKGQDDRNRIIHETQQHIYKIEREVAANRSRAYDRANHETWLALTGQEEYVNPHTGKVERDTSTFSHRWVTPGGDYIYTNSPSYNPNQDPGMPHGDYRLTPVKAR